LGYGGWTGGSWQGYGNGGKEASYNFENISVQNKFHIQLKTNEMIQHSLIFSGGGGGGGGRGRGGRQVPY